MYLPLRVFLFHCTWLLAPAILVISACQGRKTAEEVKPKLSDITESVYASVRVVPMASYSVQSIRPGFIDSIHISEGTVVEEGQLLFEIVASPNDRMKLANAELNYDEARSNFYGQNSLINNTQLEIDAMRDQLEQDSVDFKRQERLLAQEIGKRIDYDRAKLKYTASQNQVALLEQKLAQVKVNLETNYKKALNQINVEKEELADYSVVAKMAGKVYAVTKEAGDFVNSQEVIAEIGSSDRFTIEMDIDEVDITKIQLGDTVLVSLDAYPDEVFVAKVDQIADRKNDLTQTFKVDGSFLEVPPKLFYGLSGEANIVVAIRKNSMVIPTEYLLPNNKVLTANGEREVTVGVKNLEFVEILSGVDTATVLLKPEME